MGRTVKIALFAGVLALITLVGARSPCCEICLRTNSNSTCGVPTMLAVATIVNFSRREIFGAGTGHHSPIGGYLEAEDLVFVLDVNRDYQPWLIERVRLYAAMDTWDGKKKRGLLLIE